MTTLRDELQDVVDEARGMVDELGFRPFAVTVRTRTWSGGELGRGTSTDVDVLLDPAPKVEGLSGRYAFATPGRFADGDLMVTRISRSYDEADLGGGPPAAGVEVTWQVDDGDNVEEYVLAEPPEKRPLEWRCHLRRRNRKKVAST